MTRIVDGLLAHAAAHPERAAARMEDVCVTYGALAEVAHRQAERARREGLAGRRVGLWLSNSPDFLACFYGIVLAGGIAVPLPVDLPEAQLPAWADHLGLAAVWKERFRPGEPKTVWMSAGAKQCLSAGTAPDDGTGEDGLFYMAVSSGSTGKPKGILRSHRSWVESFRQMKQTFGTGGGDRLLVPGPLHYSASLIAALQVLHEGGEVVLLPQFDARRVLTALRDEGITAAFMVPAMYAKALARMPSGDGGEPCLRPIVFVTAGAKMDAALKRAWLEAFPASVLYEYYGAAELSFVSVSRAEPGMLRSEPGVSRAGAGVSGSGVSKSAPECAKTDSVGRAFAGVTLIIRDEHGRPLPPGEIGEIYVASGMIAQGYGHRGAEPFLEPVDGTYSVGDIGYVDENGYLYLVGRKQEMILRGAVNVYPLEVEQALTSCPGVREAAVFGVPDAVLGERIVAAVVGNGSELSDPRVWREWLASRLPRSRWPDVYWPVERLPFGSTGKVDRAALRREYLQREGANQAWNPSGTN